MCDCNAFELEADTSRPDLTFAQIEQSPAGVNWTFEKDVTTNLGVLNDDFLFEEIIEMTTGDGPEIVREMVAIDEEFIWILGVGGIFKIVVEDLTTMGFTSIHNGSGNIGITPIVDYVFHDSTQVDDFDISNGFVFWIDSRILYRMSVDDFAGTPTELLDLTDDFGPDGSQDMLLAAGSDRLWITKKEQNPTFRMYGFGGAFLGEVEVESDGAVTPSDMTVERDSDALVVAGTTSGD